MGPWQEDPETSPKTRRAVIERLESSDRFTTDLEFALGKASLCHDSFEAEFAYKDAYGSEFMDWLRDMLLPFLLFSMHIADIFAFTTGCYLGSANYSHHYL